MDPMKCYICDSSTKLIPGRKSATIDGQPVSGEEAEAFIASMREARG